MNEDIFFFTLKYWTTLLCLLVYPYFCPRRVRRHLFLYLRFSGYCSTTPSKPLNHFTLPFKRGVYQNIFFFILKYWTTLLCLLKEACTKTSFSPSSNLVLEFHRLVFPLPRTLSSLMESNLVLEFHRLVFPLPRTLSSLMISLLHERRHLFL